MASKRKTQNVPISEILDKSSPEPENPDLYINHAQFIVTNQEIFIEFYYIVPTQATDSANHMLAKANLKQRIVLPLSLGKGLVSGLANAIAEYEADNQVTLPNNRDRSETDKLTIWP